MHRLVHSAPGGRESYGELDLLSSLTRRQFFMPSHIVRRNCKYRARPTRPISISVKSSPQDNRSIEPSPPPSLTESPTALSSPSTSRPGLVTPIDALTDKESISAGFHASDGQHESVVQEKLSVNALQTLNGAHSASTPTKREDEVPSASQRVDNGFSVAANDVAEGAELDASLWSKLPRRYKLILTTSLAFVICNMDKVNLSIAIIPMSNQLHWNASTAGLVQSSFFWGYTLSQIPGGWFARLFTGEAVLGVGVFVWSVATAAVPLAAFFIPSLLFTRLIVGLGEGVSPSAATDLIARNVPVTERSRAVAFVFNGLNIGSVIGLVLSPAIIEHFGWESVFYIFGVLGIFWCFGFKFSTEGSDPQEACDGGEHKDFNSENPATKALGKFAEEHDTSLPFADSKKIPWKAFFESSAVWAMIYTHFCGNWGHYCILAWLPTYFSEELNLSLTNAALISVVPPLGGMLVSSFAATMADHLISKGVNATFVRKLCQTIAFVSPTAGMTLASLDFGLSQWTTVSIITCSLALSSFALGGLYCTHQDISPKYASILLGITNTAGAIPGILGVYLTGVLLDQTHSWTMALFAPCIFFWTTGAIMWNLFASSEPQSFEN